MSLQDLLCQECGGTGEIEDDELGADRCPADCVKVDLPVGVYLGPGGNPQSGYFDPSKVLLWCETHGSSSDPESVGAARSCQYRNSVRGAFCSPCRIKVATVEIVGDPA